MFSRTRTWLGAAVLWAALGLGGCDEPVKAVREWTPADHSHGADADPSRMAAPSAPSAPEQGGASRAIGALWNVSCAGCHGRGGRGDGPTPPPGAQLPDLTEAAFHAARSDAQLSEVIRSGRALMPAFGEKLTPQAIEGLVAHVRGFALPVPGAADKAAGEPSAQPAAVTP